MIEDEATARLLRIAGRRAEVPADRAARVRQAVHREWQAQTRRRAIRRPVLVGLGALAAAAMVLMILRVNTRPSAVVAPAVETVAQVEQTGGNAQFSSGAWVHAGEWLETGASARAAFRLADGTSLRLDSSSRARLLSSSVVELTAGAVYIDTGSDSTSLEVRTPFGTAHDIGTQFEVRLRGQSLRVRVRRGVVELRRGQESMAARAGTELTIDGAEAVRREIAAHGTEWDWAVSLAPPFAIEGRSLSAFLEHLCREQGWTLRYRDAGLARDSSSMILHGSVEGLRPAEALTVALATSGLVHTLREGELLVSRAAMPE